MIGNQFKLPLAYKLGAAIFVGLSLYMTGDHFGARRVQARWDLETARESAGLAKALADAVKKAAESSTIIADAISAARVALIENKGRTVVVVKEVHSVLEKNPDYADTPLPPDIARLRGDDVERSAVAAARARGVAGK